MTKIWKCLEKYLINKEVIFIQHFPPWMYIVYIFIERREPSHKLADYTFCPKVRNNYMCVGGAPHFTKNQDNL